MVKRHYLRAARLPGSRVMPAHHGRAPPHQVCASMAAPPHHHGGFILQERTAGTTATAQALTPVAVCDCRPACRCIARPHRGAAAGAAGGMQRRTGGSCGAAAVLARGAGAAFLSPPDTGKATSHGHYHLVPLMSPLAPPSCLHLRPIPATPCLVVLLLVLCLADCCSCRLQAVVGAALRLMAAQRHYCKGSFLAAASSAAAAAPAGGPELAALLAQRVGGAGTRRRAGTQCHVLGHGRESREGSQHCYGACCCLLDPWAWLVHASALPCPAPPRPPAGPVACWTPGPGMRRLRRGRQGSLPAAPRPRAALVLVGCGHDLAAAAQPEAAVHERGGGHRHARAAGLRLLAVLLAVLLAA